MLYKEPNENDHIFNNLEPEPFQEIEQPNELSILDFSTYFEPISNAHKTADIENIIQGFDQLADAYYAGPTISFDQPGYYSYFFDICYDLLCSCSHNEVIAHCLRCLKFGILSDNQLLNKFSESKQFSLQLIYCIDERGSSLFEFGLDVLSQTIAGYSKKIFSKLVYLFDSSFVFDSFSTGDLINLRLFGQVFIQISKFVSEKNFIIMLPIVKHYLSQGLADIAVSILNTILVNNSKCILRIFNFTHLSKRDLESVKMDDNEIMESLPEWYYSEPNAKSTIFLDLIKITPLLPEQSTQFDYDDILDQIVFQALSLINTAVSEWPGHFGPFFDEGICQFLNELILNPNLQIQSTACSIIEQIYCSEKSDNLFQPETISQLFNCSSFMQIFNVRIPAITAILKCILKTSDLNFYNTLMSIESFYDTLIEFLNMECEDPNGLPILILRAILRMLQCPDFDKTATANYFAEFEELYNECEYPALRMQYELLLNKLSEGE